MLLVAYIGDVLVCKCLKWLGMEDVETEQKRTPTIRFSNQHKYVEGELF